MSRLRAGGVGGLPKGPRTLRRNSLSQRLPALRTDIAARQRPIVDLCGAVPAIVALLPTAAAAHVPPALRLCRPPSPSSLLPAWLPPSLP